MCGIHLILALLLMIGTRRTLVGAFGGNTVRMHYAERLFVPLPSSWHRVTRSQGLNANYFRHASFLPHNSCSHVVEVQCTLSVQ